MGAGPSREHFAEPLSGRRVAARTAGLTGLLLAASIAVVMNGPEETAREASPQAAPTGRVPTAGQTAPARAPGPKRRLAVRASGGRAVAILVTATDRPARVRVVLRGAGTSLARTVTVRRADGHSLTFPGLAPGAYRWSATSPTATGVTGRVMVSVPARVPRPPVAPTAAPSPTVAPVPTPTQTVAPTRAPSPPPPTPRATPTRGPVDPGTLAPDPVG